jgi:transposase
MAKKINSLKVKLAGVLPHLNEKQRRIVAAAEARSLGYGGVQKISEITGISRPTIYRGLHDLDETNGKKADITRVRNPGGGRKRISEVHPDLLAALEDLIEPSTRGDPESSLRWTCKSVRTLALELEKQGFSVSYPSVASILHEQEYSLQANRKTSEGKADHPDRDLQFRHINKQVNKFLSQSIPVVSVDTKKKELVGNYKNDGKNWRKKGEYQSVLSHDFPDPKVPKAVPYGVYDIGDNTGWVNVGIDADTAEFAVESIRQWWRRLGKKKYSKAGTLMICADSGGSNAHRSHLWKRELQKLANQLKITISVCHFPPGTSKWNKIEHRLFSYITMNWRGHPLVSYETVINLIASTKTKTGLQVKARLDKKTYERGIKVSKKELDSINIKRDKFHGEWNYSISPQKIS